MERRRHVPSMETTSVYSTGKGPTGDRGPIARHCDAGQLGHRFRFNTCRCVACRCAACPCAALMPCLPPSRRRWVRRWLRLLLLRAQRSPILPDSTAPAQPLEWLPAACTKHHGTMAPLLCPPQIWAAAHCRQQVVKLGVAAARCCCLRCGCLSPAAGTARASSAAHCSAVPASTAAVPSRAIHYSRPASYCASLPHAPSPGAPAPP